MNSLSKFNSQELTMYEMNEINGGNPILIAFAIAAGTVSVMLQASAAAYGAGYILGALTN